MVGADDDVVLGEQPQGRAGGRRAGGGERAPRSRYAGLQLDVALVQCILERFPQIDGSVVREPHELLAADARVAIILSYHTQTSYEWYAAFFAALRTLEARGVAVYPSAGFKQLVSSKAQYMRLLAERGLPTCPTRVLERADVLMALRETVSAI